MGRKTELNHNTIGELQNESFAFRLPCYSCVMLFTRDAVYVQRMSANSVKAVVQFVSDDLFVGTSPSGHAIVLDTDHERSSAPSPVELLLLALGSCTATDVASIMAKKRQHVTRYVVEVSGERRDEYPRKFTSMKVHHILTGRGLSPQSGGAGHRAFRY